MRKYRITTAIGKKNNTKAEELLNELIDSKTVLPCYNSTDPRVSLTNTKDFNSYKYYDAIAKCHVRSKYESRKLEKQYGWHFMCHRL